MTAAGDILETLRASGALKEGHFVLSSGRHSDQYIEKFDLLRQPRATSEVCRIIADRFQDEEHRRRRWAHDRRRHPRVRSGTAAGRCGRLCRTIDEQRVGREFRRGTTFSPGSAGAGRRRHPDDRRIATRDTRCACESPCRSRRRGRAGRSERRRRSIWACPTLRLRPWTSRPGTWRTARCAGAASRSSNLAPRRAPRSA